MGISKLNKKNENCVGGALIFSGRPDPTWNVGKDVLNKLKKIWDSLEHCKGEFPSATPLGYRGCFLRCKPEMEWFVYEGVVRLKTVEGIEFRIDNDKKFEKSLLSSAPKGMLPIDKILLNK
jgi:hypothetical protein